ncbi:MAG TPA: acyl-CoA dehydrogenase family protein, partial [Streptosporangiaceae bacterium]
RRVPYGRLATTVATGSKGSTGSGGDGDWLAVIAPADRGGTGRGGTGRKLAGEPRDEVIFGGDTEVHDVPAGTAGYARRLLRLFRSLLIAGAAQRALDLTLTYVQEREQFGRPLARFPTVQQELARMAGEVALIGAATQAAVAAGQSWRDEDGSEAECFAELGRAALAAATGAGTGTGAGGLWPWLSGSAGAGSAV